MLKYMAQPRIRLLAVDLSGLDQAVDLRAGGGAVDGVAEQPGLAPDYKRLDRSFGRIVVDGQVTRFDIALQPAPVIRQIMHGLAQRTLCCHLRLGFIQPAFQLGQDRQAFLLSTGKPLFIADVLELALEAVQLVDHRQRDIGPSGFTLGLHFLRVHELASCMGHARQTFHTWLQR